MDALRYAEESDHQQVVKFLKQIESGEEIFQEGPFRIPNANWNVAYRRPEQPNHQRVVHFVNQAIRDADVTRVLAVSAVMNSASIAVTCKAGFEGTELDSFTLDPDAKVSAVLERVHERPPKQG